MNLVLLAAALTGFALPSGTSFEFGTEGMPSDESVLWIPQPAAAGAAVAAYASAPVVPAGRPDLFADGPQANFLALATSGRVTRRIDPEGRAADIGDGLYLDLLVEFTPCDSEPVVEDGDKIVVWLAESGDASAAAPEAELRITAGAPEGDAVVRREFTAARIGSSAATVEPGSWHRLTIRAIEGAVGDYAGFVVFIDGEVVSFGEAAPVFADLEGAARIWAERSALVVGLSPGRALASVGFAGSGAVDDISFSATPAAFAADPRNFIVNGGAAFATFGQAADHARDGDVIAFGADCEVECALPFGALADFTLDLAGHRLTGVTANEPIEISDGRSLTLIDSVGGGAVSAPFAQARDGGIVWVEDGGRLTVGLAAEGSDRGVTLEGGVFTFGGADVRIVRGRIAKSAYASAADLAPIVADPLAIDDRSDAGYYVIIPTGGAETSDWDIPGGEGGIRAFVGNDGATKYLELGEVRITATGVTVGLRAAAIDARNAEFALICKTELTDTETFSLPATLNYEKGGSDDATEGLFTVTADLSGCRRLFIVGVGPKPPAN